MHEIQDNHFIWLKSLEYLDCLIGQMNEICWEILMQLSIESYTHTKKTFDGQID